MRDGGAGVGADARPRTGEGLFSLPPAHRSGLNPEKPSRAFLSSPVPASLAPELLGLSAAL